MKTGIKISKTVSIILLVSFITNTLYLPAYGLSNSSLFKKRSHAQRYLQEKDEGLTTDIISSPSSLSIGQGLGTIIDSYKGESDFAVVHIQDCHADSAAQLNIAGIIDELATKYNIHLMCLEGASKELDTSFYDKFPDGAIKTRVAKFLLQQGLFTGPEFYKITNRDTYLRSVGAEDKRAYLEHLSLYKDSQIDKEAALAQLSALKKSIGALEEKAYSRGLKRIASASARYSQKQIKLPEYLRVITKYSMKAGIDMSGYEDLRGFLDLIREEERIDFKKAETQREGLIKELSKRLSKTDLSRLTTKVLKFRLRKVTSEEFYEYLLGLMDRAGISSRRYQELTAYMTYLKLSKKINRIKVLDEAEELEGLTQRALCRDDIQRDVVAYSKAVDILYDLYALKLTPKRLVYIEKNKDYFDLGKIKQFLRRAYAQYGIALNPVVLSAKISQRSADDSKKFYEIALRRDIALVENALRGARKYRKDKVILLAGGFHTHGITNILKSRKISYVVICPNIGAGDYEALYRERMAGKLPDIARMAEFFKQMLIAPLLTADNASPEKVEYVKRAFAMLFGMEQGLEASEDTSRQWQDMPDKDKLALLQAIDVELAARDSITLQDVQDIITQKIKAVAAAETTAAINIGPVQASLPKTAATGLKDLYGAIEGISEDDISMERVLSSVASRIQQELLSFGLNGTEVNLKLIAARLAQLFVYTGHYDRDVVGILEEMNPSPAAGRNALLAAGLLHDIGKTGPPFVSGKYIPPMVKAEDAAHNAVMRLYAVEGVTETPLGERIGKHTKIRDFLDAAVRNRKLTQSGKQALIKGLQTEILNPFTGRFFNVIDEDNPETEDTIGDFWDAHSLWSAQILKSAGVPDEIIDIVAQHHRMDVYTAPDGRAQPLVISVYTDASGDLAAYKGLIEDMPAGASADMTEEGRLLWVADKYEAFINRSGLAPDKARQIIHSIAAKTALGADAFGPLIDKLSPAGISAYRPAAVAPVSMVSTGKEQVRRISVNGWEIGVPDVRLADMAGPEGLDAFQKATDMARDISTICREWSAEQITGILRRCTGRADIKPEDLDKTIRVLFYNKGENKYVFKLIFGAKEGDGYSITIVTKAEQPLHQADIRVEMDILTELNGRAHAPRIGGRFTTSDGRDAYFVEFIPGKSLGELEEGLYGEAVRLYHGKLAAEATLGIYDALEGRAPSDIHRYNFIKIEGMDEAVPVDFDWTIKQRFPELFLRIYYYYFYQAFTQDTIRPLLDVMAAHYGRERADELVRETTRAIDEYLSNGDMDLEKEVRRRWWSEQEEPYYEPYTHSSYIFPIIGRADLEALRQRLAAEAVGAGVSIKTAATGEGAADRREPLLTAALVKAGRSFSGALSFIRDRKNVLALLLMLNTGLPGGVLHMPPLFAGGPAGQPRIERPIKEGAAARIKLESLPGKDLFRMLQWRPDARLKPFFSYLYDLHKEGNPALTEDEFLRWAKNQDTASLLNLINKHSQRRDAERGAVLYMQERLAAIREQVESAEFRKVFEWATENRGLNSAKMPYYEIFTLFNQGGSKRSRYLDVLRSDRFKEFQDFLADTYGINPNNGLKEVISSYLYPPSQRKLRSETVQKAFSILKRYFGTYVELDDITFIRTVYYILPWKIQDDAHLAELIATGAYEKKMAYKFSQYVEFNKILGVKILAAGDFSLFLRPHNEDAITRLLSGPASENRLLGAWFYYARHYPHKFANRGIWGVFGINGFMSYAGGFFLRSDIDPAKLDKFLSLFGRNLGSLDISRYGFRYIPHDFEDLLQDKAFKRFISRLLRDYPAVREADSYGFLENVVVGIVNAYRNKREFIQLNKALRRFGEQALPYLKLKDARAKIALLRLAAKKGFEALVAETGSLKADWAAGVDEETLEAIVRDLQSKNSYARRLYVAMVSAWGFKNIELNTFLKILQNEESRDFCLDPENAQKFKDISQMYSLRAEGEDIADMIIYVDGLYGLGNVVKEHAFLVGEGLGLWQRYIAPSARRSAGPRSREGVIPVALLRDNLRRLRGMQAPRFQAVAETLREFFGFDDKSIGFYDRLSQAILGFEILDEDKVDEHLGSVLTILKDPKLLQAYKEISLLYADADEFAKDSYKKVNFLIMANRIKDKPEALSILKMFKEMGFGSDLGSFNHIIKFVLSRESVTKNLRDPRFIDFYNTVSGKFYARKLSISDIAELSELFDSLKDDKKRLDILLSDAFDSAVSFIGERFYITNLDTSILLPLLHLADGFDRQKIEAILDRLKAMGEHVSANDIMLLDAVSKDPALERMLFEGRDELVEGVKGIYKGRSYPRPALGEIMRLESELRTMEHFNLTKSKESLEERIAEVKSAYTERPPIESLPVLGLLRLNLLYRSLQEQNVQKDLGSLVATDVQDKTTEYGGVFRLDAGILTPAAVGSVSEFDGAYDNNKYKFFMDGICSFHCHALNVDTSAATGPSGWLDASEGDVAYSSLYDLYDVVITPMGYPIMKNGKPDTSRIRLNVDMYWIDKRDPSKVRLNIVDMGEFVVPFSPIPKTAATGKTGMWSKLFGIKAAKTSSIDDELLGYDWFIDESVMQLIEQETWMDPRDLLPPELIPEGAPGLWVEENIEVGRLLFGRADGSTFHITDSVTTPVKSISIRGPHVLVEMDEERFNEIISEQRRDGNELLGFWHTHPGELLDIPTSQDYTCLKGYGSSVQLIMITKRTKHKGVKKVYEAVKHFSDKQVLRATEDIFMPTMGYISKGETVETDYWPVRVEPATLHGVKSAATGQPELTKWQYEILLGVKPLKGYSGRVETIGDVHGDLMALRDILEGRGFIKKGEDVNGLQDEWITEGITVVQGGDAIDRGPKNMETIYYLRYIQDAAANKKSKFIRLLGNHELIYLLRHAHGKWSNNVKILKNLGMIRGFNRDLWLYDEDLVEAIRSDILNGRIIATVEIGGKLFSHGVITPALLEKLKEQYPDIEDPAVFADITEGILKEAVETDNFDNIIFSMRLGVIDKKVNGIASAYFRNMPEFSEKADVSDYYCNRLPFDEVVFHDPGYFMENGKIGFATGKKASVVNGDTGMSAYFGSGRGVVILDENTVLAGYGEYDFVPDLSDTQLVPIIPTTIDNMPDDEFEAMERIRSLAFPEGFIETVLDGIQATLSFREKLMVQVGFSTLELRGKEGRLCIRAIDTEGDVFLREELPAMRKLVVGNEEPDLTDKGLSEGYIYIDDVSVAPEHFSLVVSETASGTWSVDIEDFGSGSGTKVISAQSDTPGIKTAATGEFMQVLAEAGIDTKAIESIMGQFADATEGEDRDGAMVSLIGFVQASREAGFYGTVAIEDEDVNITEAVLTEILLKGSNNITVKERADACAVVIRRLREVDLAAYSDKNHINVTAMILMAVGDSKDPRSMSERLTSNNSMVGAYRLSLALIDAELDGFFTVKFLQFLSELHNIENAAEMFIRLIAVMKDILSFTSHPNSIARLILEHIIESDNIKEALSELDDSKERVVPLLDIPGWLRQAGAEWSAQHVFLLLVEAGLSKVSNSQAMAARIKAIIARLGEVAAREQRNEDYAGRIVAAVLSTKDPEAAIAIVNDDKAISAAYDTLSIFNARIYSSGTEKQVGYLSSMFETRDFKETATAFNQALRGPLGVSEQLADQIGNIVLLFNNAKNPARINTAVINAIINTPDPAKNVGYLISARPFSLLFEFIGLFADQEFGYAGVGVFFSWVNGCKKHQIGDPVAAAERLKAELGRSYDMKRVYETAIGLMKNAPGFDLDIFIGYIKDMGLHKAAAIFQIYTAIRKSSYSDEALGEEAIQAGITSKGDEGVKQLKQLVDSFYRELILNGRLPADILANPIKLDLLRIASNFDGSRWRRAHLDFVTLIRDFIKADIAPLPQRFYMQDPDTGMQQLRTGTMLARKLKSDFQFTEASIIAYRRLTAEIKDALEIALLSENGRAARAKAKVLTLIDAELGEITAAAEKTFNEKAKKNLDIRRKRMEALRADVTQEDANIAVVLSNFLSQYDKRGKHPLGSELRTLLFVESFKVNNTYVDIFRNMFSSEAAMALSLSNAATVLEFLKNVVKQHVLGEGRVIEAIIPLSPKVSKDIRARYLQVKSITRDYDRAMEQYAEELVTLTIIPTRGILGELSGYFSDACWTRQTNIMRDNPDMVAFYFVEDINDPAKAKIVGGSLLILTRSQGKEAFVIRGFNPQDRIVNNYSADDLVDGFIDYLNGIPREEGSLNMAPIAATGALSNRPSINSAISERLIADREMSLDIPNTFNGYDITDTVRILKPQTASNQAPPKTAATGEAYKVSTDMAEGIADVVDNLIGAEKGLLNMLFSPYQRSDPRRFGFIIENTGYLGEADRDILRVLAEKNKEAKRDKFVVVVADDSAKRVLIQECGFAEDGIRTLNEYLAERTDGSLVGSDNMESQIAAAAEVMRVEVGTQPIGIITSEQFGQRISKLVEEKGMKGVFVAYQEVPDIPEEYIILGREKINKENATLLRLVFAELFTAFGEYMSNPKAVHAILRIIPAITDKDKFTKTLRAILSAQEATAQAA